jgi:hypothetical protein
MKFCPVVSAVDKFMVRRKKGEREREREERE